MTVLRPIVRRPITSTWIGFIAIGTVAIYVWSHHL